MTPELLQALTPLVEGVLSTIVILFVLYQIFKD